MSCRTGLLLVNLGTPDSPDPKDVYKYLIEFLTDERVIDYPWWKRQLLVRGLIVPSRYRQSAHAYRQVWTKEGSPLMVHGKEVERKLQQQLGERYMVRLAMRYQQPSIPAVLEEYRNSALDNLIIFPFFPHYASATTGSVHQKVMEQVKSWQVFPKVTFIDSYFDHPAFIEAHLEIGRNYDLDSYDHILFSFHGLPERQIKKADFIGKCLQTECCSKLNRLCYKAQCYETARQIALGLGIDKDKYTVCFQSRLGKEPWIQPYIVDCMNECIRLRKLKVLVFSPSFVSDCLETAGEIGIEYAEEFVKKGGRELQLVESLNSSPKWIEAIKTIVLNEV